MEKMERKFVVVLLNSLFSSQTFPSFYNVSCVCAMYDFENKMQVISFTYGNNNFVLIFTFID